ncbi:MAG: hypothetical protein OER83_02415 [Flavobacteriaceae bacterium]|nr:hypothetical protein [Flavobacteriaceae bacterium]MDH3795709.1 hypothetical protein [Flavobacteriaceae bacterium]
MPLPKFILGDNTDHPSTVFVVHTEYPRFILNLENDEVTWMESFNEEDEAELTQAAEALVVEAVDFYDREVGRYDS